MGAERLGPEAELAFALLLLLVMADGRRLSRRQVVDLLWPATTEERARHNLRQTLYKLRQLGVPVDADAGHVRLAPQVVDAALVLSSGADDPPAAVLLRPDVPFGEFLASYAPRFSAPFAAWVEEQRGVVHARLRRALLSLLADERRRGNWGLVETLARKCLQVDPLNEEATMALAEATALSGSKRAALQLLDGYLRELGPDAGEMRLPAAVLRRRIAERLPAQASFSAAPDCFVGREASIAFLRERLHPVLAGHGRAVLVHGEEGMGKSRLATEFGRMAELDGARVVSVASQARDVERPLSVYVDLVPLLQALPGALGCSPESLEYLRRLTDHDPEVIEPSEATREAELLFASVRRALFDLVDAVADEAPLVLCLEDAHWLDERSWRVTRDLATWFAGRPVLLLMTSRLPHATPHAPSPSPSPSTSPAQPGTPWLELHRLPPLDQGASLALFTTVVGASAPPAAFRDWAVHVAAGNPFFVRALATHWVETGELRAPGTLEALVTERVGRLTGRPERTLQACAVLGKRATLGRVEAVLEYPRHQLIEATAALEEGGFLLADGPAIPCRHDLIARAALARLQDGVRRLLHRSAGEILEREVRDARSAALLWDCAQQWTLAGERGRALSLIRSTATYLLEAGLPVEAADAYERAIELCETDAERVEMLGGEADANRLAGRWLRVLTSLQTMRGLRTGYQPSNDQPHVDLLETEARWKSGHDITELLTVAEALASEPTALPHHRFRAGEFALIFADNLCDADRARAIYQTLSPHIEAGAPSSDALQCVMIYHASYGVMDRAVEIALWLTRDDPTSVGEAEWIRRASRASIPLRRANHYEEACARVRSSFALAERLQLASAAASSADILATMMLEQDNLDLATKWHERAQYWAERQEGGAVSASIDYLAAKIALYRGDISLAERILTVPPALLLENPSIRMRNEVMSLYLHLAMQSSDEAPSPVLVSGLSAGFRQAMRLGGQDYPCAVLVSALIRMGQADDAVQLLDEYTTDTRRERGRLPSVLADLCRQLLPKSGRS
ncbi:MAG TPA: AAA family ATPase [Gemmatimonadales bacterium]